MGIGIGNSRRDTETQHRPAEPPITGNRVIVPFGSEPASSRPTIETTVRIARKSRDLRRHLLGTELYSGPSWALLFYMFESHVIQRRDTIGNVGDGAQIAPTTALRWIKRLAECGLVPISDDHLDHRRRFVELTPVGAAVMTKYFEDAMPQQIAA